MPHKVLQNLRHLCTMSHQSSLEALVSLYIKKKKSSLQGMSDIRKSSYDLFHETNLIRCGLTRSPFLLFFSGLGYQCKKL